MAEVLRDFKNIVFGSLPIEGLVAPLNKENERIVTDYTRTLFEVLDIHFKNGLLQTGLVRPGRDDQRRFTLAFVPELGNLPAHFSYFTFARDSEDVGSISAFGGKPVFVFNHSEKMVNGLNIMLNDLGVTILELIEEK